MKKTYFLDQKKFLELEVTPSELRKMLKTMEDGAEYFIKNKDEFSKKVEAGCPRIELTSSYPIGEELNLVLTWRPKYENGEVTNF